MINYPWKNEMQAEIFKFCDKDTLVPHLAVERQEQKWNRLTYSKDQISVLCSLQLPYLIKFNKDLFITFTFCYTVAKDQSSAFFHLFSICLLLFDTKLICYSPENGSKQDWLNPKHRLYDLCHKKLRTENHLPLLKWDASVLGQWGKRVCTFHHLCFQYLEQ